MQEMLVVNLYASLSRVVWRFRDLWHLLSLAESCACFNVMCWVNLAQGRCMLGSAVCQRLENDVLYKSRQKWACTLQQHMTNHYEVCLAPVSLMWYFRLPGCSSLVEHIKLCSYIGISQCPQIVSMMQAVHIIQTIM